jgi:hypothetical protein
MHSSCQQHPRRLDLAVWLGCLSSRTTGKTGATNQFYPDYQWVRFAPLPASAGTRFEHGESAYFIQIINGFVSLFHGSRYWPTADPLQSI